ncbi:MAG: hypothetical protein ACLR0V_06355 [Roseburia hominis]
MDQEAVRRSGVQGLPQGVQEALRLDQGRPHSDEQFYAWSEQAREMKKKCDREVITLDEFKDWLGKP